jgi:O-antigen biosynthesis protein
LPACYEAAEVCDLDDLKELPWPGRSFDVVLAADVLEHLREPAEVLQTLRGAMKPNGLCVVSLPNVAHVSVRFMLLQGLFRYSETGLLDESHLRFFTFESAQ